MKRKIIKILSFGIRKFSLHQLVKNQLDTDHQQRNLSMVSGSNISMHREALIVNHQKDRNKIQIGFLSQIKGNLLIFKYGGHIQIGNNTYIGEGSRIWSGNNIKIGNHVLISHDVNIIDTNSHELNSHERSQRYDELISKGEWENAGNIISSPIIIEDDVWINFNAIILKGVTIGKGAIVAAGSVVTKDVASFTLVAGNPARVVKKLN